MPAKNSLKTYIKNGYYHVYNRGVEKRVIFQDDQDYGVFLSYLKEYLSPKDKDDILVKLLKTTDYKEKSGLIKLLNINNFYEKIELLSFCLMPNHIHLLLKQIDVNSMDSFINSLNTRYVMYFNKKYKRVGPLFQGVYKATLVESDEQLLYLSGYIHRNPIKRYTLFPNENQYIERLLKQPSSLSDYLGINNTTWINKNAILSFFNKNKQYSSYKKYILEEKFTNTSIKNLIID